MPDHVHAVVGSGPAAVSCAKALLARGAEVVMLDAGLTLEPERAAIVRKLAATPPGKWQPALLERIQSQIPPGSTSLPDKLVFGSDFPYRDTKKWIPWKGTDVDLKPSLAFGGLSNVWGASMLPFHSDDMADWPVQNNQLQPHFEAVAEMTGLSAHSDDLKESYPLYTRGSTALRPSRQAELLLGKLQSRREKLRARGWRFGRSRVAIRAADCRYCCQCFHGCPYGSIYNSASTVRELQKSKRFTLRSGVLATRVAESADHAEVTFKELKTGRESTLSVSRLYIGAGVVPTAQIVLRSRNLFDRPVRLRDSQYFLFPIVLKDTAGDVRSEAFHTLSQVFIELRRPEISRHTVHLQIYGYNDLFGQALRRRLGKFAGMLEPFARRLEDRLLIVQGFLHSDESQSIDMTLRRENGADCLELRAVDDQLPRPTIRRAMMELLKNYRALGGIPLIPQVEIPRPGRSFHNGASFPMRQNPGELDTDLLGRLPGWNRIHLVDASVLPSIPAATITFTAMANAHRIGWEGAALEGAIS